MRILIGVDFVPTKSNEELFKSGAALDLVGGELYKLLKKRITAFSIWKCR